ncbi:MAG: GntR family transcriptional regulator [Firmicutes bacterium]|nr:GntR family transcriptional regulator [Bacillota bacterium]
MLLKKINHNSLKEEVYRNLKESIIYQYGIYPGDNIKIKEISEEFNVSVTPVREALKHLEGEGLVINKKGKGCYVIDPSKEDIIHLFEVRCSLEKLAVKQSASNITTSDIKHMEKINRALKEVDGNDFKVTTELNEEFHSIFINKSKNSWLRQIMDHLNDLFIFIRSNDKDNELYDAADMHTEIINAFKKNDSKLAIEKMEKHITVSRDKVLKSLKRDKQ